MSYFRSPFSRAEEDPKGPFKTPAVPVTHRSAATASRSPKTSRLTTSNTSEAPVQAGCSTLRAGGYRKKVNLKPGHSALDWHDLVTKTRSKGLITGLDRLLGEDFEILEQINSPHSLIQLRNGIPPYLIKPPLRINKEIMQKHNTQEDCWGIINGKVYSMTHYFEFHPGGADILFKECAGKDGTAAFNKYHRWVSVDKLLETSVIGVSAK